MSSRQPPDRGRDRQQRVPSGPRPSPRLVDTGTASSSGSHDTFVTAPSRGHTEYARSEYRIGAGTSKGNTGGFNLSATIYDDPESAEMGESDSTGQRPFSPSDIPQTSSPEMLSSSPPTAKSPRSKPATLRLNTLNLLAPDTSPKKPVSPGLQHWQQVRDHVMTPAEERAAHSLARTGGHDKDKKMFGLVSKAAGKIRIKQAADNVMRGDEKRKNTMAMTAQYGSLTTEQREEITRERRRFARDVKACLDACSVEETRRRLTRLVKGKGKAVDPDDGSTGPGRPQEKSYAGSVHGSQHPLQRATYDNDFYAFAPLLTELHRHMPAARAKKPWSRTCPHHAAILAELAVAFLDDSISTDGERQQALEVFGTVTRNWAADSAEEELSRWTWLCCILLWEDRHLRERGLGLLDTMLRAGSSAGDTVIRPHSAHAFQTLTVSLLQLLHAVETTSDRQERHVELVHGLLSDLTDGNIIDLDGSTISHLTAKDEQTHLQGGTTWELLWAAVGVAVGSSIELATWLLRDKAHNAQRFSPPPILHGTPPLVLQLRGRAICLFLQSMISVSKDAPRSFSTTIWQAATRMLEPEIDLVKSAWDELLLQWSRFLLVMELGQDSVDEASIIEQSEDPFRITTTATRPSSRTNVYTERIVHYWDQGGQWQDALRIAAKQQVSSAPLKSVIALIQTLLALKSLAPLAQTAVESLFERLTSVTPPPKEAKAFLRHLQSKHPQILYKPLFTCAAATSTSSLTSSLRTITTLSAILGPWTYWVRADPQMVAIVLMGGAGVKANKTEIKAGQIVEASVKLGRCAVLVELLRALDKEKSSIKADDRARVFMEQLEARVGMMVESEEKNARLPDDYRALVCLLLYRLREATGSLKKSAWRHTVIQWLHEVTNRYQDVLDIIGDEGHTPLETLKAIQQSLEALHSGQTVKAPKTKRTTAQFPPKRQATGILTSGPHDPILDVALSEAATSLLVLVQGTLTTDDWMSLVVPVWSAVDDNIAIGVKAFLMMKCAEKCPMAVQAHIMAELTNEDPAVRSSALRKLAKLHGWRYQILSRRTLTDRRGPIFHFSIQNLGYVATEIGVPHWIQPQEVQDAALQKFGNTLPLELRQRLMELGWNEDDDMVSKRDGEHLPLSTLPPLQLQAEEDSSSKSLSPIRLGRSSSNGSGHSVTVKRRKPLFAPTLTSLVVAQASRLFDVGDAVSMTTSKELIQLFQRDDANGFFRSFGEGFQDDLAGALARLRSVTSSLTPGFAYAAVNAMVGYARAMVRVDPAFPGYVDLLTTVAIVIKGLSGVSLRDIRKNRSEIVLLPASIHEDEGGYKLHAPWRDGNIEAQTAQILILNEILRNNPKDVYLIKKMLSNLQIQSSITSLSFSRAWLLLIIHLFSTVNRNYTDRAELRHFLSNVSMILRKHGHQDLPITAHSMRVFMLCSARFRRLYASVGFQSTMGATYDTYVSGNDATKDCIEYALRSFYRIHGDSFVHLACVTISEGNVVGEDLYRLLASLSKRSTTSSGVASGIRDLNKKEEIDALVHMISGPELAFSEIGTAAAERRAAKLASVNFEETVFPKPHIVKLFVTVVAASPASPRAIRFFHLLSGMIAFIDDEPSRVLLRDSVEALGKIMARCKTADDTTLRAVASTSDDGPADWTGARAAYIGFVNAYAQNRGHLSSSAIKRILELVPELLRTDAEVVGRAVSSFIGSLANTYLSSARPATFLRDIAPLFRTFVTVVDFSGLLDQISQLILDHSFDLDTETTTVIIDHYVGPSVQVLASASEDNMAFALPLRASIVRLLSSALFLRGDAWARVEHTTSTAGLLASVVLPLTLMLDAPEQVDRDAILSNLWIRILHFVLSNPKALEAARLDRSPNSIAARDVLVIQIVKIVCVRAPDTISSVRGLWVYLADRLGQMTREADESSFASTAHSTPSVADWMLWSIYELLALHRTPLMLSFRHKIQYTLSRMQEEAESRPSSPVVDRSRGSSSSPSEATVTRPRLPSQSSTWTTHKRVPSFQHESNIRQPRQSMLQDKRSRPSLTPGQGPEQLTHSHSRIPSHSLRRSPHSEVNDPFEDTDQLRRPSFVDISARRASRPSFEAFQTKLGMNNRFPSSATVRQLPGQKGGGAIVHLLGAPNQVSAAISGGLASPVHRATTPDGSNATSEILLSTEDLVAATRRAVKSVQIVFGYDVDLEDDEEPVRTWTAQDALHVISEQTKYFVESEFAAVFKPPRDETDTTTKGYDLSFGDDSFYTQYSDDKKRMDYDDDDDNNDDHTELRVPILNISPA